MASKRNHWSMGGSSWKEPGDFCYSKQFIYFFFLKTVNLRFWIKIEYNQIFCSYHFFDHKWLFLVRNYGAWSYLRGVLGRRFWSNLRLHLVYHIVDLTLAICQSLWKIISKFFHISCWGIWLASCQRIDTTWYLGSKRCDFIANIV